MGLNYILKLLTEEWRNFNIDLKSEYWFFTMTCISITLKTTIMSATTMNPMIIIKMLAGKLTTIKKHKVYSITKLLHFLRQI